jgi:hypothetical protein
LWWTERRPDERRFILGEMCFMSRNVESTLFECLRNEEITKELQIVQMTEFVEKYRRNWEEHIDRRSIDCISKRL